MSVVMNSFKLVVGNLAAAERFYSAVGLRVVSRNTGGEGIFAQEQCWMSETGDTRSCMLILSRFPESPSPPRPAYPGEAQLVFTVSNVDVTAARIVQEGGGILRPPQNRPQHGVRAAVVTDPEGHGIEIVGPMAAS